MRHSDTKNSCDTTKPTGRLQAQSHTASAPLSVWPVIHSASVSIDGAANSP